MTIEDSTAKLSAVSRSTAAEAPDYSIQLALLAAIVDSSDDAIVSKTLDGLILSWNSGAVRLFGYKAEEAIGKPITMIIPPELHEEENRILAKLKRGERIDHFETIRVSKHGRRIELSLTVSPVRDAHGRVIAASKIARDISGQKRAERTRARLAAIVEAPDDLIVSKTLDGQIRTWNSGATRILGYTAAEMIGKSMMVLVPTELCAEERQILERVRKGERIDHFDTIRVAKDGRRVPVSLAVSPIRDSRGVIIGASTVARDISERKRSEQALRQSQQGLREADRRKDEFLALLAHELRNPLAPIRYALATIKNTNLTVEQRRRAEEVIERQVGHMSLLLDDLLDVSRITRGKVELKKSRIDLTMVLEAAVEAARPILKAKHHGLSLDLPKQAVQLEADPVRLEQVFSNLLINAAKYTDSGGQIHLRAAQEGNEVIVAIRDNGIGISADMMPRLFELFAQDGMALGRSEGGLGVGLSLVRGFVTLHGGRVEVRSDGLNRGSEFTVRLPVGVSAPELPEFKVNAHGPPAGAGLKIIIVDDNRDTADTCATLLELSGHHVQTAYTGRGALELAETFRPHALVMDVGLPDVNGYELAQKIREAPWGGGTVLVAVTGRGQQGDRRRAFAAGFNHHLTKPIAAEMLLQTLREPSHREVREASIRNSASAGAPVVQPRTMGGATKILTECRQPPGVSLMSTPPTLMSTPPSSATRAQPSTPKEIAPLAPQARHEMIKTAAFYLAERRAFTPGSELDDWLAAEAAINSSLDGAKSANS